MSPRGRKKKKKKKKKKSPGRRKKKKPSWVLSLPYDLLLNCLARVSRLYYPTLSLVSKKFRSVVALPELYKTRSLLNRTESCLYMCLDTQWFTLCRKPNRALTNESSGNLFIPIPSPNLPYAWSSGLVAVGSNIYIIGGSSSKVSVLDCRFHTWHQAPSMGVKRSFPAASLLDGKIYVAGGSRNPTSGNWVQVFDPKTQTWGNVTNPGTETRDGAQVKSVGIGGKLYLLGDKNVVYNPKEARWKPIGLSMDMLSALYVNYVLIDDVLYYWESGEFKWYDCKVSLWKELKGVEGLPDFSDCKMVDLGGKMAVLWEDRVWCDGDLQRESAIWCAEIALERRDGDEMWGNVEWFEFVLTRPNSWHVFDVDVLSATV